MPEISSPLFSIIIPCYNQAHFLPGCLNSILEQSFGDWEAIVVNDGSADNTNEATRHFSTNHPNVRLVEKNNGGLSSARNAGVKECKGKWLLFLDADDFLMNGHLEEVAQYISSHPDASLIQTGYHHTAEDGKKILHTVMPVRKKDLMPDILSQNIGPVHSMIVRKDVILSAGDFDENLNSCEDWDLWIRIGKLGIKKAHISKALVGYRLAGNSMSRNAERMYLALKEVANRAVIKDFRLPEDLSGNINYTIDTRGGIKKSLLKCLGLLIMQGKVNDALRLFKEESALNNLSFLPDDFSEMNSYLSFRYLTSSVELERVFKKFYPDFEVFFNNLPFDAVKKRACMNAVFRKHRMIRNKYRWGILSPLINRISNL